MTVYLTSTTKKRNSTYIPTFSKTLSCMLKEGSSVIDPILIFERANVNHSYNYVYIPDFNRYYFVKDILYNGAKIYYYCSVDVLASFKNEIGSSSHYVTRSSYTYNGYIVDNLYPVTQEIQIKQVDLWSNAFPETIQMYVVGIVSNGAIKYYRMNYGAFTSFFSYLLSSDYADDVLGVLMNAVNENLKVMIDPLQYVACVYGYNFTTLGATGSVSSIPVGYTNVSVTGVCDTVSDLSRYVSMGLTVNFPKYDHPQVSQRGQYMNGAQFTKCTINTPFGQFPIDMVTVSQSQATYIECNVDLATGDCVLIVTAQTDTLYQTTAKNRLVDVTGKIGIPIPVSQIIAGGLNMLQAVGSVAGGAIAGLMTGNLVGGAAGFIGGTVGMIGQAAANSIPKANVTGTQGSIANNARNFTVDYIWYIAADDHNTDRGRPLCEVVQLKTIPGFILCETHEVQSSGTAEENDMILDYLNSGFFYE